MLMRRKAELNDFFGRKKDAQRDDKPLQNMSNLIQNQRQGANDSFNVEMVVKAPFKIEVDGFSSDSSRSSSPLT